MQPTAERDENVNTTDPFFKYYEEFIELAAHDLNAPLRKLGVFTDRLTNKFDSNDPKGVKEYVTRIHSSLDELRRLVGDMKEFAEMVPDTMHYSYCNTNKIMERAVGMIQELGNKQEIIIEYNDLPVVYGDEKQLGLLFHKILSNSVKFRKNNTPLQISIKAENSTDSACHRFEISDNGIGIPGNQQEKSFIPLQRLHGKTEYPGNGLGLACVKRIVENHKGKVFFDPDRMEGSSIILIIPKNQ